MGKSSGPSLSPGPLEKTQAKILKTTEEQLGGPLRNLVTPQILGTFQSSNPFSTTLPGVDRDVIEQQFTQARNNILETSPARGGQLNDQLAQLNRSRAFDVASATNQAQQLGQNRALGILPAFLPGASTMSNAVGTEQQRRMAQFQAGQQQQASLGQGIGSAVGGLLGLMK